ncbi:putative aldouronate transport system permease protein [Paenibacillus endophyticus]|uniref:Putative aldouronate transport system permease protein n=1 Tax=Paenibacillus endophyticus TaxID=1294268 RepID=A0A7W5CD82_9BACL|nr:ABC transporter permease subunit [Paenibacillus endophyticus]MBB3155566.1 putative aldouronate transport system permease protein [Paenibacillus endophyticus]
MNVIKRYSTLYLMMLPILLYFIIFTYYPLLRGLIMSFQQFRLIGDTPFIGLDNYLKVLRDPFFYDVLKNTLQIGGGILIVGFVAPIVMALLLNEIAQRKFKKIIQMVIYLPHLFSWVVIGGIWIFMLSPDGGVVNEILLALGNDRPIHFLSSEAYAKWVMIFSASWKEMGYICILFLASIVSINPSLFEAARIDGANRWQLVRRITLPALYSTMKVVLLLNMMSILRMFDQIFIMRNPAIAKYVDVIMVYTYEKGIMEFNMGVATAASFIVIGMTFILTLLTRIVIRYDN